MRFTLTVLACLALGACGTSVPDSASGVGFDNYDTYLAEKRARETALTGSALPAPDSVSAEPISGAGRSSANDAESLAAEARAALNQSRGNSGTAVVYADPNNPPPQTVSTTTGISSENDFGAVGAQRSIESDAALIAQNSAQYKVIEPTALPSRSGSSGPNIVDYALKSTHSRGTSIYSRVGINKGAKYQRNCGKYPSADQAQVEFLARGGPSRDKLGLDPDGDGYACSWDPAPFRKAVSAGGNG